MKGKYRHLNKPLRRYLNTNIRSKKKYNRKRKSLELTSNPQKSNHYINR